MRRLLAFWWIALVPALALEPPPPYFEDAQQDAQGAIWAYSRAQYNQIYSFDGKQWMERPAPFNGQPGAMPATVVRMTDGAMACVWRMADHQFAVTRHVGDQATLLGTCEGEIPNTGMTVRPFADSQNRLWITGESSKIYRADGKGGVTLVHEIIPAEYRNPNQTHSGYNQVHAVEDGHGRIWIWSNPAAGNYASLRGVLIFTGDTAEMHDSFGTIKGADVLAILRADEKHMWVAVSNDGIYKVDIDTFSIERVPDPTPKALCCVHELHAEGDDVYAVESVPVFQDALWRMHDGKWSKLIDQFDAHPYSFIPRSWLPIKEGLLVESIGRGPWFIPKEGPPALFSWRSGFPLEQAHALCQLPDGTFFSIGNGDKLFHGPLTFPPHDMENSRIVEIEEEKGWLFSADGHAWMIPRKEPIALKEWDGLKWISHELPPAANHLAVGGLNEDGRGRLWLWGKPVFIFDPHTKKWQSFPDTSAAFNALKNKPVQFLHDRWFLSPQYSADHKRIAYRTGVTEVNYFNGTTWQKWTRSQIMGKTDNDNAVGPPWFDEKGKLCVNIRNKTSWQMDDAGKWTELPFISHFPEDIWSEGHDRSSHPVPPEGSVTAKPDSIVVDNQGTTWMTWQGALYKCANGLCVSVFGPDEVNPFSTRRQLREVFVDSKGNTFVLSAAAAMGRFMIKSKSSAPHTTIAVERRGQDSVTAHFDPHAVGSFVFRWQLDDGAWQISKTDSVALDHLGNGSHVMKVVGVDDQLDQDQVPVTATFKIKIDSGRQVALLISQLKDPDFDRRKEAIQALARQSKQAEPALKAAREKADEDGQWWIDAALQEIERENAAAASPPAVPGK